MSTAALRLYVPSPDSVRSPAERRKHLRRERRGWTLRQVYQRHYRAVLEARGCSAVTFGLMEAALDRWERHTANRPLGQITEKDGQDLEQGLKAETWRGKPLAAATIRRHQAYLQQLLDCAGPDRKHGRRTVAGLKCRPKTKIPYIVADPVKQPARRPFTRAEVLRWLQWAREHLPAEADGPTAPLAPRDWYAAAIVLMYYTGLRPSTLLRLEWSMVRGKWLVIPAAIVKQGRHGLLVFLHPAARAALEAIRLPERTLVFPFARGWPQSRAWFHAQVRRQQAAAGVPALGCYGLRRLAANQFAALDAMVAAWMLGHAQRRGLEVLAAHYADMERHVARTMRRYPRLERPAAATPSPSPPSPQQRLFD